MFPQNSEDTNGMSSATDELPLAPSAEWKTPTLRRIRAGDAENGFTTAVNDGQFTTS